MQLVTFLSAAATVATVSARTAVSLNENCDKSQPYARIINRCDYPVHIWSVLKGNGCPTDGMVTLKKGEMYYENYAYAKGETPEVSTNATGISIKISKTEQCKGNDITQLEYFLDNRDVTPKDFQLNYLDVSYVDCLDNDCPTKKEGFYLQAGTSSVRSLKTTLDNSWCPILACHDQDSCAKMAYILPDDIQTKTCDLTASMDFFMCGSQAPSEEDENATPASSAEKPAYTPSPSTPLVDLHAVTAAPAVKDIPKEPANVKTEVVYVTAIEYVHEKRHAHAHAHGRRHQRFHA